VQGVLDATQLLAQFPHIGRMVPEFAQPSIRELILQNYRIVYRPRGEGVELLTIVHGAVDLAARGTARRWQDNYARPGPVLTPILPA
jgi:plasmid stabilization system protein ParE